MVACRKQVIDPRPECPRRSHRPAPGTPAVRRPRARALREHPLTRGQSSSVFISRRARLCSDMVAESSAARLGRAKKLAVFGAVANRGEHGVDLDR